MYSLDGVITDIYNSCDVTNTCNLTKCAQAQERADVGSVNIKKSRASLLAEHRPWSLAPPYVTNPYQLSFFNYTYNSLLFSFPIWFRFKG